MMTFKIVFWNDNIKDFDRMVVTAEHLEAALEFARLSNSTKVISVVRIIK